MHDQHAAIITRLPLFTGYTIDGARMLIEQGAIRDHAPNEIIFHEGGTPDSVVLVLSGKLEVFVDRNGRHLTLTQAGPGTILGELAVLCGIPRSASVKVIDQATFLEWRADAFRRMLFGDPLLSETIFRQSLKTLIDKEKSLIESLTA
jgi:CRP-like cAMP-binding protein